jgi:crotonobetainyl-CoA:carnitine CoA-transferase CaiB-like acyl-CoA transferase
MHFSASKIEYKLAPPMVGQHTEEVLKGLGYDDAKIKTLREKKVV